MTSDMFPATPDLNLFESKVSGSWRALEAARQAAVDTRRDLDSRLAEVDCSDASIVVFGSLGRDEFTEQSDVDWTLLVDGPADPKYIDVSLQIQEALDELKLGAPGREGTFGVVSNSHEIVNNIGGKDDTNKNITQRLLLLLESKAIGSPIARAAVIRSTLRRYIEEDFGWVHRMHRFAIPRFLQNDVVRYWRTIAVDFAYKRKTRAGEKWALRTAKLRLSRKLIYASGLVTCYAPHIAGCRSDVMAITEFLSSFVEMTPIERMIWLAEASPGCERPVAALLAVYDQFIGILRDPTQRGALERLRREEAASDQLFENVRKLGHEFQAALDEIFWNPPLAELNKAYGVF